MPVTITQGSSFQTNQKQNTCRSFEAGPSSSGKWWQKSVNNTWFSPKARWQRKLQNQKKKKKILETKNNYCMKSVEQTKQLNNRGWFQLAWFIKWILCSYSKQWKLNEAGYRGNPNQRQLHYRVNKVLAQIRITESTLKCCLNIG